MFTLKNSLRKQPVFHDATTGFPRNDVLEISAETTQIWAVLLIGHATWKICFNQSEAQPRSG